MRTLKCTFNVTVADWNNLCPCLLHIFLSPVIFVSSWLQKVTKLHKETFVVIYNKNGSYPGICSPELYTDVLGYVCIRMTNSTFMHRVGFAESCLISFGASPVITVYS